MKFSKDSYWFKSGIFSLLQQTTNLVFGFGGFYCLVRVLSKDQMGGWILFTTVISILEVARIGFIKYGFIKLRAEANEEDQGKLLTASLAINTAFALIVSLCMLLLGATLAEIWKTPELRTMFYLYSATSIILIPFFQFEFLQHALLDFKNVFFVYFIRSGFLFFAILFSYFGLYQLDLFQLVIINLFSALLASVASYLLVKKPLHFSSSIEGTWVWKLVHYGKYVVGTNLVSSLYGAVDSFMLGSLVSAASVATFNAASRITNLINVPSMSFSAIIFPQSAKLMSTEGKSGVKTLHEKSVGAILAIVLPCIIFILIFPEWVITIIAGPSYIDSVAILNVTIFLSFFLPFSFQFGVTLISIGYPNLNFYFTSVFFVVNAILNYFLVSTYGIIGAAYGTLGTTLISFIFMSVVLNRLVDISLLNIFRSTFDFYLMVIKIAKDQLVKYLK
ncbi:MAG: flippase [Cyclobacteriaceae bacterium]